MATLFIYPKNGPQFAFRIEKDEVILGRAAETDIPLADGYCSSRHARIRKTGEGWAIEDAGSKNGTLVNNVRISGPVLLSAGDEITLGSVRIFFDRPLPESVEITDSPVRPTRVNTAMPSRNIVAGRADGEDRLLRVLNEVSRALLFHEALPVLIEKVMDLISAHLPMDRGALLLKEGTPGRIVPRAVRVVHPQLVNSRMQVSRGLVAMAADENLSVLTTDAAEDPRFAGRQSIIDAGLHSAMCVPLETEGGTIGVVCAERVFSREPFTEDDLRLLTLLANLAAVKIDNARLVEMGQARERMEREMRLAADIQRDLLPKGCPSGEGFEIAAEAVPSLQVGGDYYDFFPLADCGLGLAVADVVGKGVSAALLMASLRAALHSEVVPAADPAALAAKLNEFIYRSSASNVFITFFFGRLDRTSGEFRYVNAGHNPPLHIGPDGSSRSLDGTGMALGMFSGSDYEQGRIVLNPGDVLILYTDGISESRNAAEEEFGAEGILAAVRRKADVSAEAVLEAVFADLRAFTDDGPLQDDRTLVVVRRIP